MRTEGGEDLAVIMQYVYVEIYHKVENSTVASTVPLSKKPTVVLFCVLVAVVTLKFIPPVHCVF